LLVFVAIAVGATLITFVNPMAGIVLGLKADVATSAILVPVLGMGYSEAENQHHTLLISLPVLGVLSIKMLLYILSRKKSMSIPAFNSVDLGLFGLAVVVGFGSFRGESFVFGTEIVARLLVFGISYYIFARTAIACKEDVKRSVMHFMVFHWLLAFGVGLYVLSNSAETIGKLTLAKVNPISFSILMGDAVLVTLFSLLAAKPSSKLVMLLLLFSLPLFGYLMLASAERGPLLSLIIGATFLSCALLLIGNEVRNFAFFGIFLCAILMSGIVVHITKPEISEGFAERLSDIQSGEHTVGARIRLYSQALDFFDESPLFGCGTGTVEMTNQRGLYVHNLILEIAAEQGAVGLALLALFLAGLIGRIKSSILIYHDPLCAFFAAAMLFHFVESMVSGTLWTYKEFYFAAGMLVFLEFLARENFNCFLQAECSTCKYECLSRSE
jgi:hypothetical protein